MIFVFVISLLMLWGEAFATEYEWVQPEDFSVRRFNEIVERSLEEKNNSSESERLLQKRARLETAKRNQKSLESNPTTNPGQNISRESLKKAADAQVRHYVQLLERLEKTVTQNKKKTRDRK